MPTKDAQVSKAPAQKGPTALAKLWCSDCQHFRRQEGEGPEGATTYFSCTGRKKARSLPSPATPGWCPYLSAIHLVVERP